MGRLSPRSNDLPNLPNLPNLHQPPQRFFYGDDGNDGTRGGWGVQRADVAHWLDQESQAGSDLPRGGARRRSRALRVELLDREDRGAQCRSPNRAGAPRARFEELPARSQRTVASGGKLLRDPRGPGGEHPARS